MANEEILELQIRDNAYEAARSLGTLSSALEKLKAAVGNGLRLKGVANQLETLKNAVNTGLDSEAVNRFERLATALETLKNLGAIKVNGLKNIAEQLNVAGALEGAKQEAAQAGQEISDAVGSGMEAVGQRTETVGNAIGNALDSASGRASELWSRLKDVLNISNSKGGSFLDGLKESATGAIGNVRKLLDDFKRILKYRMIRSVIKQITEAFTTGVKNVYFYSKAIGSSFAPAMDDAASVLLQFKNSVGAAVAPLLESLIPAMKTVVGWVIEAINYLNQFIALLRGQTSWTKAIYKQTDAFEDKTKKAKKAGNAVKELLADWDELNIIQSESGSGGSGAGKVAEDYTKMFEEETEFNSYLKDHLEDVLDYAKKIGIAIGAWKLSKAFGGILGKLFRLIAGGAMVAIGLKLSFDAGFDAGLNGFNSGNLIGIIGGALATGLGGYLITSTIGLGGGIGFAIGVGAAIIVTLYGYIEGKRNLRDKNKWGSLSMTQDEIQKFVEKQFSFDAKAEVTILSGMIENERTAREELNSAIDTFKASLNDANVKAGIKIDSDETSEAVIAAATDARKAITSVENLINKSGDGIDILIKTFGFANENGEDASKELLSSISIADKSVSEYFKGIGDELAGLIEQGEHEHWQNADTKQAALDLMERERKILDEAAKMKSELQLDTTIRSGLKNVIDRDSATRILEEQKKALDEYRMQAESAYSEQSASWDELSALATAAAADARSIGTKEAIAKAEELEDAAETYHNKAIEILGDSTSAIEKKLAETRETMAKEWAKTLQVVYEGDFKNAVTNTMDKATNPLYKDNNLVQKLIKDQKFTNAGAVLEESLKKALIAKDPNGIVKYVLEDLQGNVYDLLDAGMRQQIVDNLMEATKGNGFNVKDILMTAFHLTEEEAKQLIPKEAFELDANVKLDPEFKLEGAEEALQKELDLKTFMANVGANMKLAFTSGTLLNPSANNERMYYESPAGIHRDEDFDSILRDLGSVKETNDNQGETLRSIESLTRTIVSKQWTINITPSSGWGEHNSKSNAAYGRVTGDPLMMMNK